MKDIRVELNFTEPILGSSPADKEIYSKYILGKLEEQGIVMPNSKQQEELEAINPQEEIDNKITVFPRMADGSVCFWDYQIRGFFKGSCGMLRMISDTESVKLKNYKKRIDGLVMIKERMIPIEYTGEIDILQRPLRAQTMQGDRVALAMSERIPAGAKMTFTIQLLDPDMAKVVYEWLDYGQFNGLGQWRNGSFGRFTWRDITEEDEDLSREDISNKIADMILEKAPEEAIAKVVLKSIDVIDSEKTKDDILDQTEKLRAEGLSDVQIAHRLGYKVSELRERINEAKKKAVKQKAKTKPNL